MRRLPLLALSFVLVLAADARAADTGIQGTKLILRVRGATAKLVFVSKDSLAPFPAIGSADDPATGTPGGATIELVTPAGTGALVVPGGAGWKAKDGSLDTYTYRNSAAPGGSSPVRSLSMRQGRMLKIVARGVPIATTAPLGSVGIRITFGTTRTCALFDASTIVTDTPGAFSARDATVSPSDCSAASLGRPSMCGDGAVTEGEACEPTNDAACPGLCAADCSCAPFCGDGVLDPGEQCDGQQAGPAANCTAEPGLAQSMCLPDCRCCALLACSGPGFDLTCCPGTTCPVRIAPNQITFCRPSCQTVDDCDAGQLCILGSCRADTCASDAECGVGGFCVGVCCINLPGIGIYCG